MYFNFFSSYAGSYPLSNLTSVYHDPGMAQATQKQARLHLALGEITTNSKMTAKVKDTVRPRVRNQANIQRNGNKSNLE